MSQPRDDLQARTREALLVAILRATKHVELHSPDRLEQLASAYDHVVSGRRREDER